MADRKAPPDPSTHDAPTRAASARDAPARDAPARDAWAARIAALDKGGAASRGRKAPITVERIVATAFQIVQTDGFDALTMRRVAADLQTGPASLYAHVRNKAELDDLMIGTLCAEVRLPTPDPATWREQLTEVCRQLRDQYLRYPGISRAAFTASSHNLDTIRVSEGMLAILIGGGVAPQSAAWAIDAAHLYVSAYCYELALRRPTGSEVDERVLDRAELIERFEMLPSSRFPMTVAYAQELTAGDGHERFDFTLELLLRGLDLA